MALFKLTDQELRDAFVAHRLSEPGVFGREDIHDWVVMQRSQETPNLSIPKNMMPSDNGEDSDKLVGSWYGSISENRNEQYFSGHDFLTLFLLPSSRRFVHINPTVKSILGFTGDMFVFIHNGDNADDLPLVVQVCIKDSSYQCRIASSRAVFAMLLTLWTKHGLFQGDHREEALDEVRKKVLGYYQKRVQEEEDRAKIEFDEAVAISDDGHSIFKANEVVVVTRHRGSYCFTSVSFSGDKKIRKYGKLIKSEEPLGTDRLFTAVQSNPASMVQTYVARMIDEVRSGNADQALVRIGSHTVLFTESSLCEDPIPFDQGKRIA